MAAAKRFIQNSKVLTQSLRRQILFPSGMNMTVAVGTFINDKPVVGGACGQKPVPEVLNRWREQLLESVNRQSPAFELSARGRPAKDLDSEDEDGGSASDDPEWDDEIEDKGFGGDSDSDGEWYGSDEDKRSCYMDDLVPEGSPKKKNGW